MPKKWKCSCGGFNHKNSIICWLCKKSNPIQNHNISSNTNASNTPTIYYEKIVLKQTRSKCKNSKKSQTIKPFTINCQNSKFDSINILLTGYSRAWNIYMYNDIISLIISYYKIIFNPNHKIIQFNKDYHKNIQFNKDYKSKSKNIIYYKPHKNPKRKNLINSIKCVASNVHLSHNLIHKITNFNYISHMHTDYNMVFLEYGVGKSSILFLKNDIAFEINVPGKANESDKFSKFRHILYSDTYGFMKIAHNKMQYFSIIDWKWSDEMFINFPSKYLSKCIMIDKNKLFAIGVGGWRCFIGDLTDYNVFNTSKPMFVFDPYEKPVLCCDNECNKRIYTYTSECFQMYDIKQDKWSFMCMNRNSYGGSKKYKMIWLDDTNKNLLYATKNQSIDMIDLRTGCWNINWLCWSFSHKYAYISKSLTSAPLFKL
eukprot:494026_1